MKIKLILMTPSGSVEAFYADVTETPGGYASAGVVMATLSANGVLLGHGDTIKFERLDQIDRDDLTTEDERQLAAPRQSTQPIAGQWPVNR